MLQHYMGDRDFIRIMVRLAIPIALQNLAITSFSLIDTVMVGTLGDAALAAVGFAASWSQFMNFIIFGLSSGAAIFIARYWGARDISSIQRTYGVALIGAVGLGTIYTLISFCAPALVMRAFTDDLQVIEAGAEYLRIASFGYLGTAINMIVSTVLRSTEKVKLPLIASICGVSTNVILNYILIFGKMGVPPMGLKGAAIASLISVYVNLAVLYGVSLKQKNVAIAPLSQLLSFDGAFVIRYMNISLPVFINEVIWGGGRTILMMIYGRLGTEGIAALTAVRTIDSVMMVSFVGLCTASGIIVGKRLGANDAEGAYSDARHFAVWVPLLAVCCSILAVILRVPLMSIFSLSGASLHYGTTLMIVLAVDMPFHYFSYLMIVGIFRAGGDTKTCLLYDLYCLWGISIVLAAVCGLLFHLPLPVTYGVATITESAVKSLICAARFRSRKWILTLEKGK